jgi:Outer membrane protein beta-barrel domain
LLTQPNDAKLRLTNMTIRETGGCFMRGLHVIALAALLGSVTARPAQADGFITPYIGFNFGGDSANCASFSNCDEKRTNWGVTFGSTHGIFGIEADFGYAPNFFGKVPGESNGVFHFMTDFMLVVPAGPVQPYGFIGLGLIRPHAQFGLSNLSLKQNAFGHDIGGGLNLFFSHTVGLHGEIRQLRTFEDLTLGVFRRSEKLDFLRASAGLTFRF